MPRKFHFNNFLYTKANRFWESRCLEVDSEIVWSRRQRDLYVFRGERGFGENYWWCRRLLYKASDPEFHIYSSDGGQIIPVTNSLISWFCILWLSHLSFSALMYLLHRTLPWTSFTTLQCASWTCPLFTQMALKEKWRWGLAHRSVICHVLSLHFLFYTGASLRNIHLKTTYFKATIFFLYREIPIWASSQYPYRREANIF